MKGAKNAIRVAVPVKLARLKVWVDKGRHWSAVDKLILWALAQKPRSSAELAIEAEIPPRLITEIILRMMRFGWIELTADSKGAAFRATDAGREVIETFETLPPMTRRTSRRVSFVMEPVAWRAYGFRGLRPYRLTEIEIIERDHAVRRVVADGDWRQLSSLDVYAAADEVLADDEQLSSIDYSASETLDQFALFTVLGNAIKGLPPEAPQELLQVIKHAAAQKPSSSVTIRPRKPAVAPANLGEIRCEPLRPEDVVLTGPDHRSLLVEILRQARSAFVMHTTFLREAAFDELKEEFSRAAKRGVSIDVFWGADGDETSRKANLDAAISINLKIQNDINL